MLLGDLLARLGDPLTAEKALAALDDLPLAAAITVEANAKGVSPGELIASRLADYADGADDEEWTTLIGQMGRSGDPGGVLLRRALTSCSHGTGACSCGGAHR